MEKNDIVLKAEDFVYQLLEESLPRSYVFHDGSHTRFVTNNAQKIARKEDLKKDDLEIITLAALFHDTGYTRSYNDHEDHSIEIARTFLNNNNYPEEKIEKVISTIAATKHPHSPNGIYEKILCDADYSHLGSEQYPLKADLLRMEFEKALGKNFSESEWNNNNVDFFLSHKFFTDYAKKAYSEEKSKNLIELQRKLRKNESKNKVKKDDAGKKPEIKKPDRGIETMFRNTIRTHVEFSGLADNKANIMISINTLIIGGIVTILLRKLDSNPYLMIPTFMLLLTSLLCIIFAVIAAKPNISEGKFTRASVENKETNLLFFGNFFNMDLKEFTWGMNQLMQDPKYLYGSMIKDFYFLGQVVGRKYKYINICFNIFMFGLVASIIAYVIAVLMVPTTTLNFFE